ncbi:MAG: hypothetical protein SNJ75_09120, partial [Gemmataceae bacterium]
MARSACATPWRTWSSTWGGLVVLLIGGIALLWLNSAPADKPAQIKPVLIDETRVMKYLEAICVIGPRISGTEGMTKQQKLIEKHFTDLG